MKLSYSAVWDDTVALLRAHGSLVAALAGVFLFLPALLVAYLLPQPQPADLAQYVPLMREYLTRNWPWLLLESLLGMLGSLAILRLVFAPRGTTVASAIGYAAGLLPSYFVASLVAGCLIGVGLLLFLVPGLYLFGRLAPLAPVMVAEGQRNPIRAIGRSFEVTKGHGWAVVGMVLLVAIAGAVMMMVANALLGLIFILVAGRTLGGLLSMIVGAATGAVLASVLLLLYAALYRALGAGGSSARVD